MLAGNLNKAVVNGLYDQMAALAKKVLDRTLGKDTKEAALKELRSVRRKAGLPELPSYNTPAFSSAVQSLAQ